MYGVRQLEQRDKNQIHFLRFHSKIKLKIKVNKKKKIDNNIINNNNNKKKNKDWNSNFSSLNRLEMLRIKSSVFAIKDERLCA